MKAPDEYILIMVLCGNTELTEESLVSFSTFFVNVDKKYSSAKVNKYRYLLLVSV